MLLLVNTSAAGLIVFKDFGQSSGSTGELLEDKARTAFLTVGAPIDLADAVVRTQLRAIEGAVGAVVRWDARQPGPNGYFGAIRPDGTAQLGWTGGDWTVLREAATGLDAALSDVELQLEAIGNQIRLWTWTAGQPMPQEPTLRLVDDTIVAGTVGLGGISATFPNRGPIEGVFRHVQVDDMPVPEPTSTVLAALVLGAMHVTRHKFCRRAPCSS